MPSTFYLFPPLVRLLLHLLKSLSVFVLLLQSLFGLGNFPLRNAFYLLLLKISLQNAAAVQRCVILSDATRAIVLAILLLLCVLSAARLYFLCCVTFFRILAHVLFYTVVMQAHRSLFGALPPCWGYLKSVQRHLRIEQLVFDLLADLLTARNCILRTTFCSRVLLR